jgi:hypothetical protein
MLDSTINGNSDGITVVKHKFIASLRAFITFAEFTARAIMDKKTIKSLYEFLNLNILNLHIY